MRTPESFLKEICKLQAKHTENSEAQRWHLNDTVSKKIIAAWEGFRGAVMRELAIAGCPIGNEHGEYTIHEMLSSLRASHDWQMKECDKARASVRFLLKKYGQA